MFQTADGIIDLSLIIGKAAHTPLDARDQPARYPEFCYSKHETRYRFDPETYKGLDSLEPLLTDARSSLKGSKFLSNRLVSRSNYSIQELIWSFHAANSHKTVYKNNTFMKLGTKYETNKVQGKDIFRRMDNPKLKDKKRKLALDNCSGKLVVSSGAAQAPPKRRTHTNTHVTARTLSAK